MKIKKCTINYIQVLYILVVAKFTYGNANFPKETTKRIKIMIKQGYEISACKQRKKIRIRNDRLHFYFL